METIGSMADVGGARIGFCLKRVRQALLFQDGAQVIERTIVAVEDARFFNAGFAGGGGEAREQHAFGGAVVFVTFVIIQMLMGDVGDDGHIKITAGDAALGEAVRGDFEDTVRESGGYHPRQVTLNFQRIGSGDMKAGVEGFIADDGADRGDESGFASGGEQNRMDEAGGGGFAVGAGDADEGELPRGEAVPRGGQPTQSDTRVGS